MLLNELIEPLHLSIGPVILISGVGLLILSITNRLGRIVDRTRQLSVQYRISVVEDQERIFSELKILALRAKIVRNSSYLAVFSVLCVSLIVIVLFLGILYGLNVAYLLMGLFALSIISLFFSLALFLYDIDLSLKALWIELPALSL